MSVRIGISARTLNVGHLRGTGRYVQELLRNTLAEDGIAWTAFGNDPSRPFRAPEFFIGKSDVFEFRGDRFELWEQVGLPWRAWRGGAQLLHCAENTMPVWQPLPTVVTIHDTVLWCEPRATRLDEHYLHHVQSLAYRRCAAVITISQSSRRDIAERWPFLADRLTVIPHGIADEFFAGKAPAPIPAALQSKLCGAPYLLFLGGPQQRKRFGWAVDLLAQCGRANLHLIACGFGEPTSATQTVPSEVMHRVHFAPFVSDLELVSLYTGAVAAVYPTLYEGFGFPAVEAQAAGTPVLFSPVSSLVDLVGPLSWALPTDDFPAWLAALSEVMAMPTFARAQRAEAAKAWARQFEWRHSVQRHHDLYRAVLARSSR